MYPCTGIYTHGSHRRTVTLEKTGKLVATYIKYVTGQIAQDIQDYRLAMSDCPFVIILVKFRKYIFLMACCIKTYCVLHFV